MLLGMVRRNIIKWKVADLLNNLYKVFIDMNLYCNYHKVAFLFDASILHLDLHLYNLADFFSNEKGNHADVTDRW